MAENLTPNCAELPDPYAKARDILNGISRYRIDPRRLKMAKNGPEAKGGQGTVVIGTLIPPEEVPSWIPEQLLKRLLEANYAIKKLEWDREDAEESAKFFKAFVSELSLMAELSHPGIIKLIGFVEDMQKGDAWIVLPWEANGNVREFLQSGEWDIPERVSLIQDVLKGVEYLHTRQSPICHGDLKSLNILVNSSYHAVITDFGSARRKPNADTEEQIAPEAPRRAANDDTAQGLAPLKIEFNRTTLELTLTGPGYSLRWTAPEFLKGDLQDLPGDMWAVGWICWEIVTGKKPFEEVSHDGEVVDRVLKGKLPAIREQAQLSHVLKLCGLISDCWISNPAGRIDASNFRRRVNMMPSIAPSGSGSGASKIRSAELLLKLGQMYSLQGHKALAESHYKSALDVASRTGDQWAKANALDGLGWIYRAQSKNQEAEKAFREAHEIHSRIGNDLGAANALLSLGHIYRAQSKNQEAEKAFRKTLGMCSVIGDALGTGNSLRCLGLLFIEQHQYQEAQSSLCQALLAYRRAGSSFSLAHTLLVLAQIYRIRGNYLLAEESLTEALTIGVRLKDDRLQGAALSSLAEIFTSQLKYSATLAAPLQTGAASERTADDIRRGAVLHDLGKTFLLQSKYGQAEESYSLARAVFSRAGDGRGEASALRSLGTLYAVQGRLELATKRFAQARSTSAGISDRDGEVMALGCLMGACFQQGKLAGLRASCVDALRIYGRTQWSTTKVYATS